MKDFNDLFSSSSPARTVSPYLAACATVAVVTLAASNLLGRAAAAGDAEARTNTLVSYVLALRHLGHGYGEEGQGNRIF